MFPENIISWRLPMSHLIRIVSVAKLPLLYFAVNLPWPVLCSPLEAGGPQAVLEQQGEGVHLS